MSLDVSLMVKDSEEDECVYTANITHNLGGMAREAGIYQALWHPGRLKIEQAKDLIDIVEAGLIKLKERPEYYKKFNSSNGWGLYENFVPFVENYINALKKYQEARVEVDV